jgi:hypothetical protein
MNIIDEREPIAEGVTFSNLAIGQVYMDYDRCICIKTRDSNDGGAYNCLFHRNGEWVMGHEDATSQVEPLKTDLVLKGRDTQYD